METGVDAAAVLMLLSWRQQGIVAAAGAAGLVARGRVFECRTCGRRFPTFQALGGHRASHRRPKPYPCGRRARLEPHEGGRAPPGPRVHGCPVCGLEFEVGQALGGHMRRHRPAAAGYESGLRSGDAASVEEAGAGCASGICLELNLAPSANCEKCRNDAVRSRSYAVQGARKT